MGLRLEHFFPNNVGKISLFLDIGVDVIGMGMAQK